jgi:prepilin-type processing-associated H-X9-DG protein
MPSGVALYWWYDVLQPYIKNDQITLCPSSSGSAGTYTYLRPPGRPNPALLCYAVNAIYLSMGGGNGIAMGSIEAPSTTFWIVDSRDSELNGTADTDWGNANGIGNINKCHNDGANWGFCDGHAKWMMKSKQADWTPAND